MKRILLAIMCVGLLSTTASAQADDEMKRPAWFAVTPPAGWLKDTAQSRTIAASSFDKNAFREPRLAGGASVFVPREGGVLLIVSWLNGTQEIKNGGVAVRDHLQQIREVQQEASGGKLGWKSQVAANVAQVRFQWSNPDQIAAFARSFVWFTLENRVRLVTAECRLRVSVSEALRKACVGAIAGLRLQVSVSQRAPLELAPPTNEKGKKVKPGQDIPSTKIGAPGAGRPSVVHQETPKKQKSNDQWLLIAGVVVVLIAFYLSTRSKRGEIEVTPVEATEPSDDDDAKTGGDDDDEAGDDSDEAGDDETVASADNDADRAGNSEQDDNTSKDDEKEDA